MTFRERFLAGEADFDEIFDLTDQWNFSDETCTLREYLGLTEDEEDIWISDSDEALEEYMEKEKDRKIYFTDLDGTLLNDSKEITPDTRSAIERLSAEGHLIVLASGRAFKSVLRIASRLEMPERSSFLICYNGVQIYDMAAKKMFFSTALPFEVAKTCIEEAEKNQIHIQAYLHDEVVAAHDTDDLHAYCDRQKLQACVAQDLLAELSQEATPKLLAINYAQPEKITAFREVLHACLGDQVSLTQSNPYFLEIMPCGIDKGFAVKKLCDHLGIPISHSVASGDAENDIEMLKAAGTGVAMANADDITKAAADYVTERDNNHDGVAELLERFILKTK